ncbi:MAG: hypothetical protein JWL77_4223 [Chthonomonadaceae bacterium]|jgi:hypothetical protein|nr:hypothetical protein [Chthonomonadaceae bacterium]
MNFNGTILFARPSFSEGLARIVDIGGTLNEYNSSSSNEEADYNALLADWQAVGDAIRQAAKQYEADPTIIDSQE